MLHLEDEPQRTANGYRLPRLPAAIRVLPWRPAVVDAVLPAISDTLSRNEAVALTTLSSTANDAANDHEPDGWLLT